MFDRVLMSVGRRPNSEIPGLDKTKVKVNQKGFIEINEQRQTADPTDLRHRRRGRRTDAGTQGDARGTHRRRGHRRTQGCVRAECDSGGRVHRSGNRLGRPDRDASQRAGTRNQRRQISMGRIRTRHHARPPRRADQAAASIRRQNACSASASWAPAPAN